MPNGLGLIIDQEHQQVINSATAVPIAFGDPSADTPPTWIPPLFVENQGQTSSCAGHAEALACSHANFVETGEVVRFSRWFAYLTAQQESGFFGRDQGASIGGTLNAATKYGCCSERTYPFPGRYMTTISREAYTEAAKHKHLGDTRYDCRNWQTMLNWLTDRRCIIIGTTWYRGQSQCAWIEDKRVGSMGGFLGYHARTLIGWDTINGNLCPVVQNSHGEYWGRNGRSVITPDLWDWWRRDANFFALGFNRINEIVPQRRDWSKFNPLQNVTLNLKPSGNV